MPRIEPGNRTVPYTETQVNGFGAHHPSFYKRAYRLADIVDVDYFVPGCPPAPDQVKNVILAVVKGELPPRNP